jgi:hypothetical protein
VADVFQEVEEEVRKERLRKLWTRFGPAIVAVAVIIVVGVGGWRYWEWQQNRDAGAYGARYEQALRLAGEGKAAEAEAIFKDLAATGSPGYRRIARFSEAAAIGQRDPAAGAAAFDALAADTSLDALQRDLAQVRAALLLVDTASLDEMRRRMEPLTGANGAFRQSARELIGLVAWRTGDQDTARRWFDMILADPDVPAGVRARIEVINALADPRKPQS